MSLSTVCDDLLVAFEQARAGVMVFERGLSRVCGDTFVAFEHVWSKVGAEALGRLLCALERPYLRRGGLVLFEQHI